MVDDDNKTEHKTNNRPENNTTMEAKQGAKSGKSGKGKNQTGIINWAHREKERIAELNTQ